MSGAATLGDLSVTNGGSGVEPGAGPLVEGSSSVLVNDRGVVTLAQNGVATSKGGTNVVVSDASRGVVADDRPVARAGDATRHGEALGRIVGGSQNVVVGDGAPTPAAGVGPSYTAGAVLRYQGTERVLPEVRYVARIDQKKIAAGTTDENGRTKRIPSGGPAAVVLDLLHGQTSKVARSVTIPSSTAADVWTTVAVAQPRVRVYLLHARYPKRREHIATLSLSRHEYLAWDLWPEAFKPNLLLHDPHAPVPAGAKTNGWARSIQALQRAHKPKREVFDAPPQPADIALAAPVPLLSVLCMNQDANTEVDYRDGTICQIPTWEDDHTYRIDGLANDAFGVFQRVSVNPSAAQVHSGREWRHTHKAHNRSHLIPDLDHRADDPHWTNLHVTLGCLRVSRLTAEQLYDTLTPIRDAKFEWTTKEGTDWRKEGWELCDPKVTIIMIDRAEPASIAFVYAEEYSPDGDTAWCACAGVSAPVRVARTMKDVKSNTLRHATVTACATAAWGPDQWELFFTQGVIVDAKLYAAAVPPASAQSP